MRMFFRLLFAGLAISFSTASAQSSDDLIRYVDPLIGTRRMGHTYPGATVPFGMVQLSPDTDTIPYESGGKYNPRVYDYCAGYQYDDPTIVGFSHTHFSGTGHSDLGDFLVMPQTGALKLHPGEASRPGSGYRSRYAHSTETAAPNYYRVMLEDPHVLAELTTTHRVGFHRYTFPPGDSARIILDLMSGIYNYPDKNVWTVLRVVNDTLVTGYRQTAGWARTRTLYFALSFSRPFLTHGCRKFDAKQSYRGFWRRFNEEVNFPEAAGRQLRAWFSFPPGREVMLKMALSSVSTDGALGNLRSETPAWNFDEVRAAGQARWNQELQKVRIEGSDTLKENFYTSLYHTFLSPTVYADADGRYKGLDGNVHRASGFINYTTFSLWDTYRALHPLFTIVQPRRNSDMVQSMLAHYDQSPEHMLPVWSNSANENWCMTGYHAVSVVCDAIMKNSKGFDHQRALDACIRTANTRMYDGLGQYIDLGYIPVDRNGTAASTTLEYAYDDWTIAQAARKLGRTRDADQFLRRSQQYRRIFDTATGFMRAREERGTFRAPFDPLSTSGQGFIEGNSWNYTLFVPHDPGSLGTLLGGDRKFIAYLDTLFTMHLPDAFFAETEDITRDGIIGGYVHGNEPAHHAAYLYNWTSEPWKTQQWVRQILRQQYRNAPDGLGGNDDAGQMSAWYIFSSLGFYPVSPGSSQYQLGSPAVKSATIRLENGKTFTVDAVDQGEGNVYVRRVTLNGKPLERPYITHEEIMAGGKLTFYMSAEHPD